MRLGSQVQALLWPMSSHEVDAAVSRAEARRPDLEMAVQTMADALTAGEGKEMIHQAALQQFLWWYLPRRYPEEDWSVPGGSGVRAARRARLGAPREYRPLRADRQGVGRMGHGFRGGSGGVPALPTDPRASSRPIRRCWPGGRSWVAMRPVPSMPSSGRWVMPSPPGSWYREDPGGARQR